MCIQCIYSSTFYYQNEKSHTQYNNALILKTCFYVHRFIDTCCRNDFNAYVHTPS